MPSTFEFIDGLGVISILASVNSSRSLSRCRPRATMRRRMKEPAGGSGVSHKFILTQTRSPAHSADSRCTRRRVPAWSATAGHIRTPTSFMPVPACARTAAAAQLYSSIAATNPRRARVGPSSRASQQAPPNESSAAPAIRPTTNAAGASSDTPSSNPATSGGDNSKVKPTPVSANAVDNQQRSSHGASRYCAIFW